MIELRANTDRLVRDFFHLTAIDSLSLQERKLADAVIPLLSELGCTVEEDDAAAAIGGNCGNILARLPGYPPQSSQAECAPILLAAHMDTVVPGLGKEAFMQEDGRITGNGKSVLGADDVTGIVEILEGLRILQENQIPHRPIEILLTVSEESYGMGVKAFDLDKIKAKDAYVMDLAGPVGPAAVQAPSLIWFEIVIEGKAAHAGFEPENGIHALQAAAKAIARLPQGRIDEKTTFNVGKIKGGRVSNIVPDSCRLSGEVRSYDHQHAEDIMRDVEKVFREETEKLGATFTMNQQVCIKAYKIPEDSPVCRRYLKALDCIGLTAETLDRKDVFVSTFGGSDNNYLSNSGLQGIVAACGMYNPHSTSEYTFVKDLEKGAELAAAFCMIKDEE